MIIGNGSIAKLLNDREGVIFFAAGVSDSRIGCAENSGAQMARERKLLFHHLLNNVDASLMFVYFGTMSKFYGRSAYIDHKNKMEAMVRELSDNYTIINLGNVWECTNQNTFRNAMKAHTERGGINKILDEYKYMISEKQLNFITDNLPLTGKHEISIFGEMVLVKDALKR